MKTLKRRIFGDDILVYLLSSSFCIPCIAFLFYGKGMKSQNPVLDDSFVGSSYAILLWMFFIKLSLLCKILQNIKSNCS